MAFPRVSTAGNFFTTARFAAIFRTPMAKTIVTTAGSPSGMAATARLMAIMNISSGATFSMTPSTKITAQITMAPTPRIFPVLSSFTCKGVCAGSSSIIIPAILPTCVRMPVSTTTALACPAVTTLLEKTMFRRSPNGALGENFASASFSTGTDSPVREASSAFRLKLSSKRASAGTMSPRLSCNMSPGTSSSDGNTTCFPARMTVAFGDDSFFSASMAFSALLSCTTPTTAFSTTMKRMMTESM